MVIGKRVPEVSVIMPTYNRAELAMRAVESVLAQDHAGFELVIVDDGSTDNTSEVLGAITDKRVRVFRQDNGGPGSARNLGLNKARGSCIAYLDSDNVWHPNFLSVMLSEVGNNVMAYSSQNLLLCSSAGGQRKIIGRRVRNDSFNPVALLQGNFIDINVVLHCADLLRSVGTFDESLRSLEDWDLFVRIAIAHPFGVKHVDQVLCDYYYFTASDGSMATVTNAATPDDQLRVFGREARDETTELLRRKFAEMTRGNSS